MTERKLGPDRAPTIVQAARTPERDRIFATLAKRGALGKG